MIVRPPIVTLSVPTVPDAELESPYEICQLSPEEVWNVEDLEGSKMVWPDPSWEIIDDGSSVDQTC